MPILNIRTSLSFKFRLLIQAGNTSVFEIVTSILKVFSFRMIRMESEKKKKADMLFSAIGVFQMQTPCRAAVGLRSTYAVQ